MTHIPSQIVAALTTVLAVSFAALAEERHHTDFSSYEWTEINPGAQWSPRAGLQAIQLRDKLYIMGGRTPRPPSFPFIPGDSDIWGDVWRSDDEGLSWTQIVATDDPGHWPARAYFQAVKKRRHMYVLGGQDFNLEPNICPPGVPGCPPFVSTSQFFSDVWRSRDGIRWQQMTADAGWAGRAGLSSVVLRNEIYVFGGSFNDDPAVIGGPPTRVYFNDVWKSRNGRHWVRLTEAAPWAPRAGAVAVTRGNYIYLLGGEDGFTCDPLPFCEPPYFNDVWRTRNGKDWELVTAAAEWSARPGHQCAVVRRNFVCFGGFGLLGNPQDVWVSRNGKDWTQVSDSPWNVQQPTGIKYDFDVLVTRSPRNRWKQSIMTFGGDRETFDFTDPLNYLNIDNDVWEFAPPAQ